MSNPFSQLNGYNYTNPYNNSHTGYNGFTGPPVQHPQLHCDNLVSTHYRQLQSDNNSAQFSSRQHLSSSNGFSSHNSGLNSSFVNAQASPANSVSSNPTNSSPAFPPVSPLFNPPALSPGFPNRAVYAPVLSPVTPPSSNSASPVLRKVPASQVPSRAQLNPLEELEAVTKQISKEKRGASNLNNSGQLNRSLSPTDQFVQDLLNGKDSGSSTQTHSATNSQPNTQQGVHNLKSDQSKLFPNSQVNPGFLQNNFPPSQQQVIGVRAPNLGYQQQRNNFSNTGQFCGPSGYQNRGTYPPVTPSVPVPVPPNPRCPPVYPQLTNGVSVNGTRGLGNPPPLSPVVSNQVAINQ